MMQEQMMQTMQTMATELPGILRQLESLDPVHRGAARERLSDFARMTARWRKGPAVAQHRRVVTFGAMSLNADD